MNLNQLYYFRKLAELQHFTQAAAELYISQPSLSYSITNLENELGISLFEKKGRNVVLTNHGTEFYKCVDEVLSKLDHGVALLKQSSDISRSKINIGTIPILSSDIVPNIRTYMNSFPQTTFDIFTCMTGKEVITGVVDGIYDIGFCSKIENRNSLIFVPIVRHELVVITNIGHELTKRKKLGISVLQKYPLITYRENNPFGKSIRSLFREQKTAPNIIFSFDDDITICEMVVQEFGIAILVNTPILQNYNVSIVPLEVKSDLPMMYLSYKKNSSRSKTIRNFIHILKTSTSPTG